ncbi:hypothetical protein TanjilG_21489 [Lupinus angustifolius]|uniref:FAD-binding FR-type domain-containing protein n=1 Tax=Lupinus angustifolius TaxID=3871 RepID=A0A4P1QUL0_LUPAN|nr:hypothetical protein TanjilG_21489 [Lupinus angustifolius]
MEIEENQQESWSKTKKRTPSFSNKTRNGSNKKTTRFKEEEELVEIVFDLGDDDNIGDGSRESEAALLATGLKKRMSSSKKVDRGAHVALKSLKFMTSKNFEDNGWSQVKKLFHDLALDDKLHRNKFGECIGKGHKVKLSVKDMVDKNADGRITVEEVKEIITLSASANNLSKIQEQAGEYATFIMEEFDRDKLGFIELQVLETVLLQTLEQSTHITTNNEVLRILSKKEDTTKKYNPIKSGFKALSYFVYENWKRVWVIALWLSICVALFTWKFIQYKNHVVFHVMGYCVTTAKGAAETLKFNMALILLPVCRNTITWLRTKTKLGVVVPFDDNINFHKVIAFGITIGVVLHVIPHLTCDFPRLLHATNIEYNPMKPFFGDVRPNNYWWFLKGTEGWTGMVMVVVMVIAYIFAAKTWFRRNKPNLPKIKKNVVVYPGKGKERVLALYVSKPKGFKYSSGQYIVVKCLDVSPFEWHPFSITSAPGDNYISVHIKNKGDWTSQMIGVFAKLCESASGDDPSGVLQLDMLQGNNNIPRMPKLLIDGPYGAPAQDYKKYEVILLIGLGIGATPMISILKDVLNNIEQQKDIEQGIVESGFKNNKKKDFVTNHAYFYWVTREQGSFEWFKNVMNEVVENDKDGIIEFHNHCTSVYKEDDLRCALITMLQFLHHAKNGVDIVSGTKVKTHFGKPTWRSVFENVAFKEKGKIVGVFFCGPQELVGELKSLSLEFSRIEGGTTFDFHRENF